MSGSNSPWDAWTQAWGPMAPMVAPWAQVMKMWSDSMMTWVPGAGEMASSWMAPGMWMGGAFGVPDLVPSVCSPTPTEVRGELRPGAAGLDLFADDLSGVGSTDSLKGITLRCDADKNRVIVNVRVPNEQPAGTYRGLVRDSHGREQGHITVTVHPMDEPS